MRDGSACRSIGVSNFKLDELQRVVKTGKTIPAVNQVRTMFVPSLCVGD